MLDLMKRVTAEVITPRFRQLAPSEIDQKSPGDFVTVADRQAEQIFTRELLRACPDALIVGEENAFSRPELLDALPRAGHAFTVDPLDGTRNFVQGSPDHAVMISELINGEAVRGWIWLPQFEQAWVAERGSGLRCNGSPVSPPEPAVPPRGATSRRAWRNFTAGGRLAPVVSTRFCAGIDYTRLLAGRIDYLAHWRVKPWDHLPGSVMVRELGGDIRLLDGRRYTAATDSGAILSATDGKLLETVREEWVEHLPELGH